VRRTTPAEFVLAHTQVRPSPFVPEVRLHLADDSIELWQATAVAVDRGDLSPPFWAFVWAGGQALARYVLDHPEVVAGKRVHDLATGSGVAAIAAARAGAAGVTVSDVDPAAVAAAIRNAEANGVEISAGTPDGDVVLAGDVFYSGTVAGQMTARLRQARRDSADVLVGDPARGFFPQRLFSRLTTYLVPVPPALEETETLETGVWRMR
jgi:predicted nicotinamide N-methyase